MPTETSWENSRAIFNFVIFLAVCMYVSAQAWLAADCSEKAISTYSPIFDRMEVRTAIDTIHTHFWPDPQDPYSVLQRRPSPEVDAAWERISNASAFGISAVEAKRLGKSPDTLWPWPRKDNEPVQYMAMTDTFHQLHCLDNMRRAAFPEYYGDLKAEFHNHSFPFADHTLHCQYVLMRALTCHADVEMTTFTKVRGYEGLWQDFTLQRKCRNFEDLIEWMEENGRAFDSEEQHRRVPEGIRELPAAGRAIPLYER